MKTGTRPTFAINRAIDQQIKLRQARFYRGPIERTIVPLTAAVVRTFRDYLKLRCANGLPRIGSEAEREALLMKRNVAKAGQPWEPGLTSNAMRKHLTELGQAAAERIKAHAAKEPSLERIAELEALARQVTTISPHPLRHGLAYRMWKTASPAHIQTILGHSRVATTLKYGKLMEDDFRTALEDASRIR